MVTGSQAAGVATFPCFQLLVASCCPTVVREPIYISASKVQTARYGEPLAVAQADNSRHWGSLWASSWRKHQSSWETGPSIWVQR